jgi:hypothetical protein
LMWPYLVYSSNTGSKNGMNFSEQLAIMFQR